MKFFKLLLKILCFDAVFFCIGIILNGNIFINVLGSVILIIAIIYTAVIFISYTDFMKKINNMGEMGNTKSNSLCVELFENIELYSDEKIRKNNAEIFNKQTELTALQSQINPHFLYNTLDSIRGEALCNDDNNVADMIGALASFFRYSISKSGNVTRLRDELENVKNYMKIQEYRFRNRFHLEIEIDEADTKAYDCYLPRLILQPIVENAIYHGLDEVRTGGLVTIEVSLLEDYLMIVVMDNGKGMTVEELKNLNKSIFDRDFRKIVENSNSHNTGIALPNIHKRIQLLYGSEYGISVYSSFGKGTDIEILLPLQFKAYEESYEKDNITG